jgi:capsular polysaccharide biosynthesis protein
MSEPANVNQPQTLDVTQAVNQNDDEEEIDLGEIFYLLWKHIISIVLFAVIGCAVAIAVTSLLITPKYTASARMYILSSSSDSAIDLSDLQISSQLKADYQELLTSRSILEDVISQQNLDYTPAELKKMITVTNPTDTRILDVAVESEDPQEAANIANALTENGKDYLPQIMKTQKPSVFESAEVPKVQSSPSLMKNTLIGGLIAAAAYIAVLIIRYLMNDTLVTPDDVNKYLGVQPLAVIPEGHMPHSSRRKGKE